MGRQRAKTNQERYQEGLRRKKAEEADEDSLKVLRCATLLRTNTHLMIPKIGVAIHKRALWQDNKYIGIVERLICDETVSDQIDIPRGHMTHQLPESEYEIRYHPRQEAIR